MNKISPAYRTDPFEPADPVLRDFLDENYLKKLPYFSHASEKRVMIAFAGGSAVGKSTLAQAIGAEFKGLVIESDGIKRVLATYEPQIPQDDMNTITWNYTLELYGRLPDLTENGFVVRDGMVHWYYDRLFPVFERAGYKTIVIQFDISREKNEALIARRGDTPTATAARLLQLLDDHEIHIRRFLESYTPDIVIGENELFDAKPVIDKLRILI